VVADEPGADYGYGEAQITAFEDTWHWGQQAEDEFREILQQPNTDVAELMQAPRSFLKETDMMVYLTAMCIRLLELHRVLKPTGSLYLHCDPTASHYRKVVLDGIFGPERFLSEVIWKRTTAHSGAKRFAPIHDTVLVYSKTGNFHWSDIRTEYAQEYLDKYYRFDDGDGRRYWRADLCAAGTRKGSSGQPWRGIDPGQKGMHWKYTIETLDELDAAGRIYWPPQGTMPQYKRHTDELKGKAIGDIWDDIDRINPVGGASLGYPTQRPLALLERLIAASSNEGDVVLDPFCGCGTAVHKLKRRWIGIDITHLAVSLIERRLKEAFPGIAFDVHGTPTDIAAAPDLAERDKHQFQLWACGLVNAQPYQGGRKGADRGIDGPLYIEVGKNKTDKVIVQVKGGANVTRANIATLEGDVDREKAAIGLFVTLAEPTKEMQ
jgi:adenine specific DNA methylase Mod